MASKSMQIVYERSKQMFPFPPLPATKVRDSSTHCVWYGSTQWLQFNKFIATTLSSNIEAKLSSL